MTSPPSKQCSWLTRVLASEPNSLMRTEGRGGEKGEKQSAFSSHDKEDSAPVPVSGDLIVSNLRFSLEFSWVPTILVTESCSVCLRSPCGSVKESEFLSAA